MHVKYEVVVKGAAYVFGSVCTVLMAVPPNQYSNTKTAMVCVIAGVLSLLGFLSRNYANYQDLSKVEAVGTEVLLSTIVKGKADQVDTVTDSK